MLTLCRCPTATAPHHQRPCFIRHVRQVEPKFPGTRQWGHQVVREGERRGHMLHVTCHPSQTWDMISCFPVLRGAQQLQLCCCQYVSIIYYSLKLYCFRLVPLIYLWCKDVGFKYAGLTVLFLSILGFLGLGRAWGHRYLAWGHQPLSNLWYPHTIVGDTALDVWHLLTQKSEWESICVHFSQFHTNVCMFVWINSSQSHSCSLGYFSSQTSVSAEYPSHQIGV